MSNAKMFYTQLQWTTISSNTLKLNVKTKYHLFYPPYACSFSFSHHTLPLSFYFLVLPQPMPLTISLPFSHTSSHAAFFSFSFFFFVLVLPQPTLPSSLPFSHALRYFPSLNQCCQKPKFFPSPSDWSQKPNTTLLPLRSWGIMLHGFDLVGFVGLIWGVSMATISSPSTHTTKLPSLFPCLTQLPFPQSTLPKTQVLPLSPWLKPNTQHHSSPSKVMRHSASWVWFGGFRESNLVSLSG